MIRAAEELTRIPINPEDISSATLLGVSFSMKPAPGSQGRSAARSLLCYALNTVGGIYPEVSLLDLRNHKLPFFDGRMPEQQDDPVLKFVLCCIDRAGALLLSIPAYWSGVSGVFKNFVDTLCGPLYDLQDDDHTVFEDKPVGLLIVGADEASARDGSDQAEKILLSTGARIVGAPVVVSNPRSADVDLELISHEVIALGAQLAQHAYLTRRRNPRC